ncbi:unnamed protein product [Gongylonema pulchrum]|uniref:LIM domain-binding protein 2 n=1 Tax=Gongylonema pulchrum TaxID=637853 RepID=A0A183DN44_9BILA|nr:unnamed protein product [Gongylonema pulchrum]
MYNRTALPTPADTANPAGGYDAKPAPVPFPASSGVEQNYRSVAGAIAFQNGQLLQTRPAADSTAPRMDTTAVGQAAAAAAAAQQQQQLNGSVGLMSMNAAAPLNGQVQPFPEHPATHRNAAMQKPPILDSRGVASAVQYSTVAGYAQPTGAAQFAGNVPMAAQMPAPAGPLPPQMQAPARPPQPEMPPAARPMMPQMPLPAGPMPAHMPAPPQPQMPGLAGPLHPPAPDPAAAHPPAPTGPPLHPPLPGAAMQPRSAALMQAQMPAPAAAMPPQVPTMTNSRPPAPPPFPPGFGADAPPYFANSAANVGPNAAQIPGAPSGLPGQSFEQQQQYADQMNSAFPKPAGGADHAPAQASNMYMNQPSASFGPPPVPGTYGQGARMGGPPPVPGEVMGAGVPGLYQQRPRLDPSLMPSIAQVIEEDRSTRGGVFPTGYPTAEHPPLTTTEFTAQDQGNCNPKFMRSTMYVAPASSDMLKSTQLPFAIAINPFARLHPSEARHLSYRRFWLIPSAISDLEFLQMIPPIVDLGELGPVRCQRCKAYMCAFMEFQDGGRRFKCPFCLSSTAVNDAYFAHLDHTGRRTDIQHRPEQFLGSYEFVATKPYCKVCFIAVAVLSVSCSQLFTLMRGRDCTKHIVAPDALMRIAVYFFFFFFAFRDMGQQKSSLHVGFATYDQTIHFYNLKNHMKRPEMLVVGDVNDMFVPLVDGFLVTLEEADVVLNSLLDEIEKMFSDSKITEMLLGPVIQAGLDALKCADRAGKLFIFHTNLPLFDAPGKLKNRDDRKLLGTDKEKAVLQPGIDFYSKLGVECVKAGCAVDIFLFPNSFVDVASISPVCSLSGGSMYKYLYFEAQRDSGRFLADLSHDIGREIVFDVMMRVRSSTGLRPTGFFGLFYMENSTDMEVGAIDCDKALHVEIRHDDKLPEGNAYLQTAILFTSCSGQRRLRIHNLALVVSADYNHLYRVADPDCLVSFLFKQAEYIVRDKTPKEMKDSVNSRCAQMLATYREKCSEQAPLGQLILPECLKLLPLFANCIIRNDAVSGGSDMNVDDRAYMMQLVAALRVEDALLLLYPMVFPVSDLVLEQYATELSLPCCIRASYDNFAPEKAYIIYNGVTMFLWIGLKVPQEWIQDVFNSTSVAHLNVENHVVPERDNARSRAIRFVIDRVNTNRVRHMKLFLIRQQDALEAWMKKFLVEDRTANMPSYVDYLCNIHREIRNLLS